VPLRGLVLYKHGGKIQRVRHSCGLDGDLEWWGVSCLHSRGVRCHVSGCGGVSSISNWQSANLQQPAHLVEEPHSISTSH
jgi:hypothetical protein